MKRNHFKHDETHQARLTTMAFARQLEFIKSVTRGRPLIDLQVSVATLIKRIPAFRCAEMREELWVVSQTRSDDYSPEASSSSPEPSLPEKFDTESSTPKKFRTRKNHSRNERRAKKMKNPKRPLASRLTCAAHTPLCQCGDIHPHPGHTPLCRCGDIHPNPGPPTLAPVQHCVGRSGTSTEKSSKDS